MKPRVRTLSLKSRISFAVISTVLLQVQCCFPAVADCAPPGPVSPVTVLQEPSIPQSRQLVGPGVNLSNPGTISIDAPATSPVIVNTYSSGSVFSPAANTYTAVSNASQINLPGTTSIPAGAVIEIAITGAQGATNIVTNGGAGNENIIFNGSNTNGSLTVNNGDQIVFVNQGSGSWYVRTFLPNGSAWTIKQGGTGASTQPSALSNLAGAGNAGDLLYLNGSGNWTHLPVGNNGSLLTVAGGLPSWTGPTVSGGNYFGTGTDGDAVISTPTVVGDTSSDSGFVVMNYKSLTINNGGSLTTQVRKYGLLVYVQGDCIINSGGSINMDSKGANATPTVATTISKLQLPLVSTGTFVTETSNQNNVISLGTFTDTLAGGTGGAAPASGAAGHPGNTATNGTGGGGSGGASGSRLGAAGTTGNTYCGGNGGGGAGGAATATASGGSTPTSAGQGGSGQNSSAQIGQNMHVGFTGGGGGGAGGNNSSQTGGATGHDALSETGAGISGTPSGGGGGTLILVVGGSLLINGSVSANGAAGGAGANAGYFIFNAHNQYLGSTSPTMVWTNATTTINQGGTMRAIHNGDNVSAGVYVAAIEVFTLGVQTATPLNASGIPTTALGAGGAGGGGSGGGRIILLYGGNYANSGTVTANGGAGGAASTLGSTLGQAGGAGGNGSITNAQIIKAGAY